MRIAVIGTGRIGGTLGGKWRAAGHDVVYGARQGTGEGPGGAPLAPIGDAIKDADVVVLAIPGGAVAWHGPGSTARCWTARPSSTPRTTWAAARPTAAPRSPRPSPTSATSAPSTRSGWENFADPQPGSALFFAAAPSARATAEELISAVGLEPAYAGDEDATGTVDALLPLWFAMVKLNGGNRKVALGIIR